MKNSIQHRYSFPHPPEIVWAYLTEPDLIELWLMKNDFKPVVGHTFQFREKPIPALHFDGLFHCRVLEIIPFEKLVYTWTCGPGENDNPIDSVVSWALEATETGTELFLEHSGFSDTDNLPFYEGLKDGWLKNMQKMAQRINTQKV